jgi:4-amino-4-deoxy-L-arabinose transferase-like glycosyltransferase
MKRNLFYFKGKTEKFGLNIIDIVFIIFCFIIFCYYYIEITRLENPVHDAAVYLLNAEAWLYNTQLDNNYRPPMISWLIAAIWSFSGENWLIVKYLQSIFTIGAGLILYLLLKKHKSRVFALAVVVLTMVNASVFSYSTQIITEGLALFFLLLTLYLLDIKKESCWFLAGIAIGLTFASRYPIVFQSLVIFIVECIIIRKPNLILRTILGASISISLVVLIVFLKSGSFETALAKDTVFSIFLSPFYLANSIDIWGFVFLMLPIAFLYKKTYVDKFNYIFIGWFLFSMMFWSANLTNHEYRFTIQFTPAVYFLSVLGIENFFKYLKGLHQ